MEGINHQLNGTEFRVYSEFYKDNLEDYLKLSRSKNLRNKVIIGGYATDKIYSAAVKNGKTLDKRAKVFLTRWDKKYYKTGGKGDYRVFNIDGLKVLPIICYEICFPNAWEKLKEKVDLIIHHVGTPMYSKSQFTRWRNLQKRISLWFNAPVVCAVGRGKGPDISGIVFNNELKNKNRS